MNVYEPFSIKISFKFIIQTRKLLTYANFFIMVTNLRKLNFDFVDVIFHSH